MTNITSKADVDAYLNHDRIECLECGQRYQFLPVHLKRAHQLSAEEYRERHNLPTGTPLAGLGYRQAQRDKLNRMIAAGTLTHDHLPAAVEQARRAGRGQRRDYDLAEQGEIAKRIEHPQLPPGAKRANGRDADHARQYQREYRALQAGNITQEQLKFIKDNFFIQGMDWTARRLGMTKPELAAIVEQIGLKQPIKIRRWTPQEDEFIAAHLDQHGTAWVAQQLGRTYNGVNTRVTTLGLKKGSRKQVPRQPWTDADDTKLKQMLEAGSSYAEAAKALGRSLSATRAQVFKMGYTFQQQWRRYTDEELSTIITLFGQGKTAADIARHLKRDANSVRGKMIELGLVGKTPRWSAEQEKFLIDNYASLGAAGCAEALGRTVNSIQARAARLGLRRR